MPQLEPPFEQVQQHYDLSDKFFALFLDPSRTYSCAYFERESMSLAEAQLAKIDLALCKCDLQPGMRLLDIGCGWGATIRRAATRYRVDAVGLTLSENQYRHATRELGSLPDGAGSARVCLMGWEQFEEPVDRIVSIGAFEHFRFDRYRHFFERCRNLLPTGGRMLLHTIVMHTPETLRRVGIPLRHEHVLFTKFIRDEIFPGGQLCSPEYVRRHAEAAGFRQLRAHFLQPHYARTLDIWAANLAAHRDRAIDLTSEETYAKYMRYLTGCAKHFRSGHIDVVQFTLSAA